MSATETHFIDTPGHGYLAVDMNALWPLRLDHGWEPSEFSLVDGCTVYLEEDCDAPAFAELTGLDWNAVPTVHRADVPGARYMRLGASGRTRGV